MTKTPNITKIVLTGGPCAGKTTALSWIQNEFTDLGYTVLFIPETATELITGNITPGSMPTGKAFQHSLLDLQLAKEKVFESAARQMDVDKVLIVCDRGVMDSKAYMTQQDFAELAKERGTTEVQMRDNYDAVFHLVTAAKGAEKFYTTANNTARTETPEQARQLDDKLISAWTGHPHLRVIDNASSFEDKQRRLMAEIRGFLGEPEPHEIERKFLIDYPDIASLEQNPNCRKVEIMQTYLTSKEGDEIRVRQRGEGDSFVYFRTTKHKVGPADRIEMEQRLSQNEYVKELMNADPERAPLRKTRYCLTSDNQYFEIDVYPFWKDKAIMEIELQSPNQQIRFPEGIHVRKEVTDDSHYSNAELSRQLRQRGQRRLPNVAEPSSSEPTEQYN